MRFALFLCTCVACASDALILPDAVRGAGYQAALGLPFPARCPSADAIWKITAGRVPPGITADVNGVRGVARQAGDYEFVLTAATSCGGIPIPARLTVRMPPLLSVSADSLLIEAEAGSLPQMRRVLVSSDWPDLPIWLSKVEAKWLSAEAGAPATPPAGSALTGVPIALRVNPDGLQAGIYREIVRVTGWNAANTISIEVTLVVKPPPRW